MDKGRKRNSDPPKKANVISESVSTLRKQKQTKKPSVKLSFKSPLLSKSHAELCSPEQSKHVLGKLAEIFRMLSEDSDIAPLQVRKTVIVGINAVTKALESESESINFVIICKEIVPQVLVEHLPIMCCIKKVPCLIVDCSSRRLGNCINLPLAATTAIIQNESNARNPFWQQCMQTFQQYATIPHIPWLDQNSHLYQSPELAESHPKRSKR